MTKIAVDMMGGDNGLETTVLGVIKALKLNPKVELFLVGNSDKICKILEEKDIGSDMINRIEFLHTEDEDNVSMDTKINNKRKLLKEYKKSSMFQAIDITKDGKTDGIVSAGNTGALVTASMIRLKRLIDGGSFALGSSFPNIFDRISVKNDKSFVLDLGAKIETTSEEMVKNVKMAKIYLEETLGIRNPEVGIVMPGELTNEQKKLLNKLKKIKGITVTKIDPLNTINSTANILIINGFEGNVLLKACEGAVETWKRRFKKIVKNNLVQLSSNPLHFKKNITKLLEDGIKNFLDYKLEANSDIEIIVPNLDNKGSCCLHGIKDKNISNKAGDIIKKYIENHNKTPKVGVLNIGEESGKGRKLETNLSNELKEIEGINFTGFIESNDLLNTDCDIVFTDNKTGYITINSIRGIIENLNKKVREKMTGFSILKLTMNKLSNSNILGELEIAKELKELTKETEKGAILLGASKVVIKAHGGADENAFANAILMACDIANKRVLEQIKKAEKSEIKKDSKIN